MLVDVTAGLLASWFMVRFLDILCEKAGLEVGETEQALVSGNYFVVVKANRKREYFISYARWGGQCLLWCLISCLVNLAHQAKVLCLLIQFKTLGFNALAGLIIGL